MKTNKSKKSSKPKMSRTSVKRKNSSSLKKRGFDFRPYFITIFFSITILSYLLLFALENDKSETISLENFMIRDKVSFKYNGKKKINYYKKEKQKIFSDRGNDSVEGTETIAEFYDSYRSKYERSGNKNSYKNSEYYKKHAYFYDLIQNINQKKYLKARKYFKSLTKTEQNNILHNEFSAKKNDQRFLANLAIFTGSVMHKGDLTFMRSLLTGSKNEIVSYYLSAAIFKIENPNQLDPDEIKRYFAEPKPLAKGE